MGEGAEEVKERRWEDLKDRGRRRRKPLMNKSASAVCAFVCLIFYNRSETVHHGPACRKTLCFSLGGMITVLTEPTFAGQ